MRVMRLHGPRDLRMHDEPRPVPAAGEVLVEIRSVGVCASDLHYYRDGRIGTTRLKEPVVIGHEASGIVVELGPDVEGLKPGDYVAIEPARSCGECEFCRSGHPNVCPQVLFFGTPPTDGCLREFISWPARLLLKTPSGLTFDEIAMLEPFAVGVHAVNLAQLQGGESIAVLGAGAIGLSVLQSLRQHNPGKIAVSDPILERTSLAARLGADHTCSSGLEAAVSAITAGRGVDIAFECAGSEEGVGECCRVVRPRGQVLIAGIPDGDVYPFEASASRRKELSAIFVRRSNNTTGQAIEWASEKRIELACYATHRFSLENAKEAMEMAAAKKDGIIRAIIDLSL